MRTSYEAAAEATIRAETDPVFYAAFRRARSAFKRRYGGADVGRTARSRLDAPAFVIVHDWVTHRCAEFDTSGKRIRFVREWFDR